MDKSSAVSAAEKLMSMTPDEILVKIRMLQIEAPDRKQIRDIFVTAYHAVCEQKLSLALGNEPLRSNDYAQAASESTLDSRTGLYGKYRDEKANGSPVDPKADYFVLRLDTDKAARKAAIYYAELTQSERLLKDLERLGRWHGD